MPAADDLTLLADAAREAGEILRGYFKRGSRSWQKPDAAGPVTEADMAANDALHEQLRGARPDYGWLSEEGPDDADRLSAKRTFLIDPLDGTRAFIEGDHSWSISLAVVEDGRAMSGVVYLPMRNKLYAAQKGHGTTLDGLPVSVSDRDGLEGAAVLSSRINFDPRHWRDDRPPDVRRQFRSSLAYRLSLVAQGRYDAMFRLRPAREWDVAAGAVLVEEAGGRMTGRDGAPLVFNKTDPVFDGVIAAPPTLHADILSQLV